MPKACVLLSCLLIILLLRPQAHAEFQLKWTFLRGFHFLSLIVNLAPFATSKPVTPKVFINEINSHDPSGSEVIYKYNTFIVDLLCNEMFFFLNVF